MNRRWYTFGAAVRILSIAAFLLQQSALAVTPEVLQLARWETTANMVAARSPDLVRIEHYEIPRELISADLASSFSEEMKKSFVFERDGREYVRWLINPEDTKWHLKVAEWMERQQLNPEKKTYFNAWYTASRSMIIEDPQTKQQFSAKVSTNITGGNWRDKPQPISDAEQVRLASDFVADVVRVVPMKHAVFLAEPGEYSIGAIDQAMLVRSLGDLPKGGRFFLPGFSAVHETVGREIAEANGSRNPAEFWNEHYNKPLARALAEFAAYTGLSFDSPHSQNFLIELDANKRPTGRIVIRDFGDTYAFQEYFEALGYERFLKLWERENIVKGKLQISIGLLHGNTPPSWLPLSKYNQWGKDFYATFEREFSRITGISAETMNRVFLSVPQTHSYFNKSYPIGADAAPHFASMKEKLGDLNTFEVNQKIASRGDCAALARRVGP